MNQLDENTSAEKVLARVNTYEIFSTHEDVFIVRDSATKLVLSHGRFNQKFKFPDLLKAVEKLQPLKLKHQIVPRPPVTEESPE